MNNRGFTLLEVMLALALSSLVLIAVTIAIDVNLRLLDSGRTHVEEAQLARALLRRIADDLRNAIYYDPVNVQKLMANMMPQVAAAGDTLDDMYDDVQEKAGDAGIKIEDLETSTPSESAEPPPVPGLYGNQYELQVDTSRLPRMDQFGGVVSPDGNLSMADRLSEVKTVAYYVTDAPPDEPIFETGAPPLHGGLVRRQRDRAIAAFALERGLLIGVEDAERIAPEVAAIEFQYCNGTEWFDEWDSVEQGGLPMAVNIAIAVVPVRRRNDAEWLAQQLALGSTADVGDGLLIYRLLVHLPSARPTGDEEASESSDGFSEEDGEESSGTGDSGSSGGSASTGGGSPR